MRLFAKKREKTITLEKYCPVFTTVDGAKHIGMPFPWLLSEELAYSPETYMMFDVTERGFVRGADSAFYPLKNIISIKWDKIGEKNVIDNFFHKTSLYYTSDEIEKMTEHTTTDAE